MTTNRENTERPPVFVSGYQRSGTTLLGSIVDRHPEISIFLESFFIPRYYFTQKIYWPLDRRENMIRLARSIATQESSIINDLVFEESMLDELRGASYEELIRVLMANWAAKRGSNRWGDKSPGYITKFPQLREMFPNAKFIHIVRDGRDVWLSLKKLGWERNVVRVASLWGRTVATTMQYGREVLRENYLEVRYESLLDDPEAEVHRICAFLDESFEVSMLEPNSSSGRNKAFAPWPKINEKIDSKNQFKWKSQLSTWELDLFDRACGSYIKEIGYERVATSSFAARLAWRLFAAMGKIEGFFKSSANRTIIVAREIRFRFKRK